MTSQHQLRSAPAPRFSVVTAVYNVAAYLDAYIASIDAQTFPSADVEVIVVDDGSTDESLAMLRAWQDRRPELVTVLTKENGGQSTARNLGMEVARGEWITFPDPDDVLEPEYLSEVDAFLAANPETVLVGTNRLMLNDATGELKDNHPLRMHFRQGNRLHDIDDLPEYFHGSAPAAFFRLARLRELEIRFDDHVRPNFEDGHFCCRYLLAADRPLVGFVATARYHYRKRQNSTSTLQTSLTKPDRYTKVLRNGYLALLRSSAAERGSAPEWLQNYVLYELSWYFSSQDSGAGAVTGATGSVSEEFHQLLGEIVGYLDDELIASFDLRPMDRAWKELLLHSYDPTPWNDPFVTVTAMDHDQRLVRVTYLFTGPLPDEEFRGRGRPMEPVHAKIRDIDYHGRVLLQERIVWLPMRLLRVRLGGRPVEVKLTPPEAPTYAARVPRMAREHPAPARPTPSRRRRKGRDGLPTRWQDRAVLHLAAAWPVRRLFRNAWVLMDRIHDADDSGERLFRHLRRHRPDINAWFVLESGTPDWKRLQRDGHRRVIPHGSVRWKLLMANCQHLVSSHADVPVMRPPAILRFMEPSWRFTFLQHGVIKDDLANWLNRKDIDLFVTSTPAELESIAGDHTRYVFTTKETKLTGLPRFDRLLELGQRFGVERRDLLLVAPTWRDWLVPTLGIGSQRRRVDLAGFLESDYARNWLALLRSPQVAEAAELQGLTIGFLPHPNLQSILGKLDLPPYVRPMTFVGNDVQEYFARAALLVTDYSSMAFNTAYIDRPTVYFQFDADRIAAGGHVGRQGYFDYSRDGFGPVAHTVQEAVSAVVDAVKHGPTPTPEYGLRIAATFPLRDGRCCERVVAAIEEMTRRRRHRPAPRSEVPRLVSRVTATRPGRLARRMGGLLARRAVDLAGRGARR